MRARPSSNNRSTKPSRTNVKTNGGSKGIVKKTSKGTVKKVVPDLSVIRQPVDTSVCGLRQAVKVFETGTPEVLNLLTYDCDVVYECKVCRNLFRSIANFISHKRIYCTLRFTRAQDARSKKEGEDFTLVLQEQAQEKLPTRITARKDLSSIMETLNGQSYASGKEGDQGGLENKSTTVHLEPMENTAFGVFQTVLKADSDNLMRTQVDELHKLYAKNEVVLGPDGRVLENGFADLQSGEAETYYNDDNDLSCPSCNIKFSTKKSLSRHLKMMHESIRTSYTCPCCKNYFCNPWSVYRHLTRVHKKTNEQVRRLRSQVQKKDVKIIKHDVVNNKKGTSPSRKKSPEDTQNRLQQNDKEWIDHFEDDWENQQCGGCGRKFERKAALISHAQICHKRLVTCNRIEQNYKRVTNNELISALVCSKKPVPRPSPEKKIGIQVRMNYCKKGVSDRQQTSSRSVIGDDSDIEAVSVDGRDNIFQQSLEFDQICSNSNSSCTSGSYQKLADAFLNSRGDRENKANTYETSGLKASNFLGRDIGKSKSLEEKCLQLRSVLENVNSEDLKTDTKIKDGENLSYCDGNTDNSSESNASAVSSFSSHLTQLTDKSDACEVEEPMITSDRLPNTEADSTSLPNTEDVPETFLTIKDEEISIMYPNDDDRLEEVSTSVISVKSLDCASESQVDSQNLKVEEVSPEQKTISVVKDESKTIIKEIELENTITVLTRNQLKAICKDDLPPNNKTQTSIQSGSTKKRNYDTEVELATKEMAKKKLSKFIDEKQNQCTVCMKRFKTIAEAYRHIPSHTQWKRYECLFNGCTFQTFLKSACLHHVTLHTKDSTDLSLSLVGKINPNKWNLKIVKTKSPGKGKNEKKIHRVINKKDTAKSQTKPIVSQKLAISLTKQKLKKNLANQQLKKTLATKKLKKVLASKTFVNTTKRLDKKLINNTKPVQTKIKSKGSSKKSEAKDLLIRVGKKQMLLTDFKNFNDTPNKINGNNLLVKKNKPLPKTKNKTKNVDLPKTKTSIISNQEVVYSSPIQNGIYGSELLDMGEPVVKITNCNIDDLRGNTSVIIEETRDNITISNINLGNVEIIPGRRRACRASTHRSTINSLEHRKERTSFPVLRVVTSDSESSININSENLNEPTSLEEEETQDPERPVDDMHLRIMEVIFGPPPPQAPGRPVRNKSRPKRDNDFILSSQKDGDKDSVEGKSNVNKKLSKTLSDSKLTDTTKKSK